MASNRAGLVLILDRGGADHWHTKRRCISLPAESGLASTFVFDSVDSRHRLRNNAANRVASVRVGTAGDGCGDGCSDAAVARLLEDPRGV